MLEYIIICIGLVLAIFMWLIYKKIDQKKNNGDEIKSALDLERERKKDLSDFKQANKPKKTDYIQDYFLQLGAYTLAHNVFYKTSITSGVILLCTVDNLFQDFKIDGAELIMYQNLFLGRLKKFNELKNIS